MASNPTTTWYFKDWMTELTLRKCSMSAQGLWMSMLCIMVGSPRYGFLEVHRVPVSLCELARMTGQNKGLVSRWVRELETAGVFDRNDEGVIFCRRLVREAHARDEWIERKSTRRGVSTGGGVPVQKHPEKRNPSSQSNQDVGPDDSRARTGHLSTKSTYRENPSSSVREVAARAPELREAARHAHDIEPEPTAPEEDTPPIPAADLARKMADLTSSLAANLRLQDPTSGPPESLPPAIPSPEEFAAIVARQDAGRATREDWKAFDRYMDELARQQPIIAA